MADERQLISRYQQGDKAAAEAIFHAYHSQVHGVAYRMLGGSPDTDDVVQEIFMRAFRGLKNFRGESSLKTWMYRIATNTCLNHVDKLKRLQAVDSLDDPLGEEGGETRGSAIASPVRGPDEAVLGGELEAVIEQALERLPPDFRTALVLRDLEGLSYEEVAESTGATLGTVKSRISRARTQAMRWLKEYLA